MNGGCRCRDTSELWDSEAHSYVADHLKLIGQSDDGWTDHFSCPDGVAEWFGDNPASESHGGGPYRLRRLPLEPACRCRRLSVLEGWEATVYAKEHLQAVDSAQSNDLYQCLRTGSRWRLVLGERELRQYSEPVMWPRLELIPQGDS